MTVLYVLIPLALVCGIGAVLAFLWAVHAGQLDDLETPAVRILTDDDRPPSAPARRTGTAQTRAALTRSAPPA